MNSIQLKNHILDFTKKYDLSDLKERILSLKEDNIDVNVAFLGEFSSGKTSLMKHIMEKITDNRFLYFDLENTANLSVFNKGANEFLAYLNYQNLSKTEINYITSIGMNKIISPLDNINFEGDN